MTRRVFLHVGLPKSGTTYLQAVLEGNKQALKEDTGLLFPGSSWDDQVRATQDVREMGGYDDASGAWPALVEEIHAWPGDVAVSMEWLSAADPAHVRRIVGDLAPARVTAVFTVRDLGRAVPSTWQEMMKNRRTWSYSEFLDAASGPEALSTRPGRRFWLKVDICGMLDTWATALPADDLVVVTVPAASSPHDLLWERLCTVLGIEASDYATRTDPRNQSLGMESTEVLRRLNLLYRSSPMTRKDYDTTFKKLLARQVLADRRDQESRLRVPRTYRPWVEAAAQQQIEGISARGVRVVGDLDELLPVFTDDGLDDPDDADPTALLDAALEAVMGLAQEQHRLAAELEAITRQRDRYQARLRRRGRRP
jgi:hypothetical protein